MLLGGSGTGVIVVEVQGSGGGVLVNGGCEGDRWVGNGDFKGVVICSDSCWIGVTCGVLVLPLIISTFSECRRFRLPTGFGCSADVLGPIENYLLMKITSTT